MTSSYGINVPEPSQIDYHADLHARRAARAMQRIDPGDVLAVINGRIAQETDPAKHPLYPMVCWHLEKCLTPLDGGQFFDRWRQLGSLAPHVRNITPSCFQPLPWPWRSADTRGSSCRSHVEYMPQYLVGEIL
jgi:hypothetical protein